MRDFTPTRPARDPLPPRRVGANARLHADSALSGGARRTLVPGGSVTSRALALLGAYDDTHRRLSPTELAARAELPLPTAHRVVAELGRDRARLATALGVAARGVGRALGTPGNLDP